MAQDFYNTNIRGDRGKLLFHAQPSAWYRSINVALIKPFSNECWSCGGSEASQWLEFFSLRISLRSHLCVEEIVPLTWENRVWARFSMSNRATEHWQWILFPVITLTFHTEKSLSFKLVLLETYPRIIQTFKIIRPISELCRKPSRNFMSQNYPCCFVIMRPKLQAQYLPYVQFRAEVGSIWAFIPYNSSSQFKSHIPPARFSEAVYSKARNGFNIWLCVKRRPARLCFVFEHWMHFN